MAVKEHKSSIGNLNANIMILIVYIGAAVIGALGSLRYVAFILPLVIYLLEKNSTFVKKNSLQALTLNILATIVYIVFGIISAMVIPKYSFDWYTLTYKVVSGSKFMYEFSAFIRWIMAVAVLVFSIIATVKAYKYEEYEIPFINKISSMIENLLNKISGDSKNSEVKVAEKVEEVKEDKE